MCLAIGVFNINNKNLRLNGHSKDEVMPLQQYWAINWISVKAPSANYWNINKVKFFIDEACISDFAVTHKVANTASGVCLEALEVSGGQGAEGS